ADEGEPGERTPRDLQSGLVVVGEPSRRHLTDHVERAEPPVAARAGRDHAALLHQRSVDRAPFGGRRQRRIRKVDIAAPEQVVGVMVPAAQADGHSGAQRTRYGAIQLRGARRLVAVVDEGDPVSDKRSGGNRIGIDRPRAEGPLPAAHPEATVRHNGLTEGGRVELPVAERSTSPDNPLLLLVNVPYQTEAGLEIVLVVRHELVLPIERVLERGIRVDRVVAGLGGKLLPAPPDAYGDD